MSDFFVNDPVSGDVVKEEVAELVQTPQEEIVDAPIPEPAPVPAPASEIAPEQDITPKLEPVTEVVEIASITAAPIIAEAEIVGAVEKKEDEISEVASNFDKAVSLNPKSEYDQIREIQKVRSHLTSGKCCLGVENFS
jgi:hypothetical protein